MGEGGGGSKHEGSVFTHVFWFKLPENFHNMKDASGKFSLLNLRRA
jgi:hypothetical protein